MSLRSLSAEQVREIAARYQLKITGETGSRPECIELCVAFMLVVPAILLLLVLFISWVVDITMPMSLAAILVLGGAALIDWASLFLLFLISVPKLGVAIVLNRYTGVYHVCIPGWNIVYPWEECYWQTDDLTQRAGTVRKTSTFLTHDGVSISFNWTVQEGPYLPLMALNIRYNAEDVAGAVTEIVENLISEEILDADAATIMSGGTEIVKLQDKLLEAMQGKPVEFQGKPMYFKDKFNSSIEERVGSNMEIATLGPPTFADEYKKALVTRKTVKIMEESAASLVKELAIDGGQAMDTVLILNKEGVKKDIFKIEADNSIKALVSAIAGAFGKASHT